MELIELHERFGKTRQFELWDLIAVDLGGNRFSTVDFINPGGVTAARHQDDKAIRSLIRTTVVGFLFFFRRGGIAQKMSGAIAGCKALLL